ncbi:protein LAZ1 homolog 2 isoform X2 [Zea mays]|uniref:LAZ1-2 n=1 Tax=Zea mays TaxID=4577 RepID=A0A1D6EWJ9_MAIZE|nr:protein LAZ1 homolog 2 isoform X2 [Zea mays]ONM23892.1 Protein LAZ1 [Zea mays]QCI62297.1 LAZ1-2 [Zea mays]
MLSLPLWVFLISRVARHFLHSWMLLRNAMKHCYLNISISKNIVPDEIKGGKGGGVLHHSFHVSVFLDSMFHSDYCTSGSWAVPQLELAPHKPLAKFLCIKGIVFFCFWQGFALGILAGAGVIKSHHFWRDVEHIQEAIQNVLVILEMVVFFVVPSTGLFGSTPIHMD